MHSFRSRLYKRQCCNVSTFVRENGSNKDAYWTLARASQSLVSRLTIRCYPLSGLRSSPNQAPAIFYLSQILNFISIYLHFQGSHPGLTFFSFICNLQTAAWDLLNTLRLCTEKKSIFWVTHLLCFDSLECILRLDVSLPDSTFNSLGCLCFDNVFLKVANSFAHNEILSSVIMAQISLCSSYIQELGNLSHKVFFYVLLRRTFGNTKEKPLKFIDIYKLRL